MTIRRPILLIGLFILLWLGMAQIRSQSTGTASQQFSNQFQCAGNHWIALPSQSTIRTAEDLCAANPNFVSVMQRFPRDLEAIPGGAREWTYDCSRHTCTPSLETSSPSEPGCSASTCFCVDRGEGFEVVVSAPSSLQVAGCESQVRVNLPSGGPSYLIGAPYQPNLGIVHWQDLARWVGLTSTGPKRGLITYWDDCTGTIETEFAGQAAPSRLVIPGKGYLIRYIDTLGHQYINPASNISCDADGDGLADEQDPCTDTDGDGYGDPGFPANTCPPDNCPTVANPTQSDIDQDGVGDACDRCPTAYNPQQTDQDGDGIADACDSCIDSDGDGYGDAGIAANACPPDNCPGRSNPSQADADGDGIGDACDNCPSVPNPDQADRDRDEIGDACDGCTGSGPSVIVMVITDPLSVNGGGLAVKSIDPTSPFAAFGIGHAQLAQLDAFSFGPGGLCGPSGCDAVVLNVASLGVNCNFGAVSPSLKGVFVSFVASGKKLIIYDSECPPQDYTWLPFPFTTSSPGALGSPATLRIVENNTLSSSDPQSRFFIDAAAISAGTDAVSHMNVMTTLDPNWCVDMVGTNSLGVTGPVHAYARYPAGSGGGLIIYNGLAMDDDSSTKAPITATPPGNLAKIWLQELLQSSNPSCLPCSVRANGIALEPALSLNPVGTTHTITARVNDQFGGPLPAVAVTFSIDTGPNRGASGACAPNVGCTTDANGLVSFTYRDNGGGGIDQITACYVGTTGARVCSRTVVKEWLDCNDGNPCTDDSIDQAGGCVHVPNGASCDDGLACTTGDKCSNGVCTGSPPPPAEVGDSLEFADGQLLLWSPANAASAYNLYRGLVAFGQWSFDQGCLDPAIPTPGAMDTENPPLGQAFYYLVSSTNACGESGLGFTSSGDPRPNPSPCL